MANQRLSQISRLMKLLAAPLTSERSRILEQSWKDQAQPGAADTGQEPEWCHPPGVHGLHDLQGDGERAEQRGDRARLQGDYQPG